MAKLRQFNEIARDFTDVADFVVVYIEEAHPTDGWAFKVRFFKNSSVSRQSSFDNIYFSHKPTKYFLS